MKNKVKQNCPGLVAFYNTPSGNKARWAYSTVQCSRAHTRLFSCVTVKVIRNMLYDTIRYDEEFNMVSEAKCDQLNLAHVTENKNSIKKLKQTPVPTWFSTD